MPGEGRLTHAAVDRILALLDGTAGHDIDLAVDGLSLRAEGRAAAPSRSVAAVEPVAAFPAPLPSGPQAVLAPRAGGITLPAGLVPGRAVSADTDIATIGPEGAGELVRAGVAGTVTDLFVADGDLVEYGQPLVRLTPAA
ncbi:biotin/lipoyl-binding protein [Azospirillum sp. RWY-5-1]|uniref:Biotin/lipoyl-binding protein n=1 Tax=Azospirillum oleiclasticum TaxID=2735135 RepID=A0ABX2TH24_9PROT|nr:biotin/lipoyl-binding protein [Azospirillum oleiclasticum]NYZ15573.1 biotin/lipoyl-binding protein [Azospirillum oleiclasticum]NYZ22596.1 biotin/lipoyl-binding protein [Azospirillum oleiclasticum]